MRLYLDSAYIAKCYLREPGTDAVLDLVEASQTRVSSEWAKVEVVAVLHRHLREGKIDRPTFEGLLEQFQRESASGVWQWVAVNTERLLEATRAFQTLPPDCFLRSADCLHLVSARQAGFREVYSNDKRLLDACPHFGLVGRDVIA